MSLRGRRLALAGAGVAAALGLGEALVRCLAPQATFSTIRETPGYYASSPRYPLVLAAGFRGSQEAPEFQTEIRTNALGLRDLHDGIAKPPGVRRIACLGDSFTFGQGVRMEEAWPARLEALLAGSPAGRVEAWNLGYAAGFSPDSYALYARRDLPRLAPDVVVVQLFPFNDIDDIRSNRWEDPGPDGFPERILSTLAFIDDRGRRLSSESYPLRLRLPVLRDSQLFQLAAKEAPGSEGLRGNGIPYSYLVHQRVFPPDLEEAWGRFGRSMEVLKEAAGNRLLVVLVPTLCQVEDSPRNRAAYLPRPDWPFDPEEPNRRIRESLVVRGIPCLDLLSGLRQGVSEGRWKLEDLYYARDQHFRPLGQSVMAEAVARDLSGQGWLPVESRP